MAEKLTPAGLVVGLILEDKEQPAPGKPGQAAPASDKTEAQPKRTSAKKPKA